MLLSHLHPTDQEIIRMLHQNARMPYARIGERLKLSRVAIQKRVESLIDNGVIESFTIRLSDANKPEKYLSVFFEMEIEPKYLEKAGNTLAEEPEVISICHMTGQSTLHMHALLKNDEELEHFLFKKIYALDGIVNVDTQTVIKQFK